MGSGAGPMYDLPSTPGIGMDQFALLHTLMARLHFVVAALVFMVFHLILATAGLLALWAWQVEPHAALDGLLRFAQSRPGALLGVAGISLATGLALWTRWLWRTTRKRLHAYLWKGIAEAAATDE